MVLRTLVAASLLVLAGCGSVGVEGAEFGGPPRAHRDFPPQTLEGIVYAQARFTDHATEFGADLIEEARVVPIRLKMQLRGRGANEAQILLNPARMGLRLVLPDGAVLAPVSLDDVAKVLDDDVAAKVRKAAFRGGLLHSDPTEGYLFFSLQPPTEFAMSGRVVRHAHQGVVRSLDVADSLLAFKIAIGGDDTQSPFYVGIER